LKLATWNVNSLKVRLPQLLDWLGREQPDVACLQEIKLEDAKFPVQEIRAAGYEAAFAGQRTYNGVAILSRVSPAEVGAGIPDYPDPQQRVLAASVQGLRIVCAYVPNGQSVDSDKYRYKLEWLAAFTAWLRTSLSRYERLAVLGDFNIAPEERDVYDPKAWEGQVLFSQPERRAFGALLALGLSDALRLVEQGDKLFTWWDYRMNAFKRGLGLRIDHILLSQPLARQCTAVRIGKELRAAERPSDHAPVIAEI
jgi:exodeoxyribonuclease-3